MHLALTGVDSFNAQTGMTTPDFGMPSLVFLPFYASALVSPCSHGAATSSRAYDNLKWWHDAQLYLQCDVTKKK